MTEHKLGRFVEHDPRSREYAFAIAPVVNLPVQWHISGPVFNQGDLSACTGFAMAALLNSDMFLPARVHAHRDKLLTDKDAVDLYSRATRLDNVPGSYPPSDSGSTGLAVAKAAKQLGFIDLYQHCFSWDMFRGAIQRQPVIVGTAWTNMMFTPRKDGTVRPGSLTDQTIIGGHEYLCYGIEYRTNMLSFRNSWGSDWGTGGNFKMRFTDFQKLLMCPVMPGDATVPHGIGVP